MIKALLALPVLALVLTGCTPPVDNADDGVVRIVASTNVYGDIAQTIGGDDVEVTSILDDPSADPHQFEANARVQLALSKADVVIVNGGGYDDFATQMLEASGNDDAIVLNAVELAGFDLGDEFNEHVWYEYGAMQILTEAIARALDEVDPAGAEGHSAGYQQLDKGLLALGAQADGLTAIAAGTGVIITEPVPLYMLSAAGLVNLTPPEFSEAIEEDADVPAQLLQDVLNLIGDGSASLVVYNAQTGGPQTDAILDIASEYGIPAIGVTETLPEGVSYLQWQKGYLDLIEDALTD